MSTINQNLKCDSLRKSCSDEWVAKTYAEYLLTCAQNKMDFMNDIEEACADETIDQFFDDATEEYSEIADSINSSLISSLDGSLEGIDTITKDSQVYLDIIDEGIADDGPIAQWYHTYIDDQATDLEIHAAFQNKTLDEMLSDSSVAYDMCQQKAIQVLENRNVDPSTFKLTMNEGYVDAKSLITQMILATNITSNIDIVCDACDSQDEAISNVTFNLQEIWNQFKGQYASSICWSQGFIAATKDNLADKLAYYETLLSTYFTDAKESWMSNISMVKSTLAATSERISDFISMAEEELGWKQVMDEHTVIDDTDVSQYTGASPLSDIDLNSAKGVALATVKTVAAVGYGIWQGIKALASKVWKKVRPYVMAITNNPVDIGVVNSSSKSYTIADWMYNKKDIEAFYEGFRFEQIAQSDDEEFKQAYINKIKDKWIVYNCYFGEIIFRVNDADWIHADPQPYHDGLYINYEYQLKPRALNINKLIDYSVVSKSGTGNYCSAGVNVTKIISGTTPHNLNQDFIDACDACDFYCDDDTDEKLVYTGILVSMNLLSALAKGAALEMFYSADHVDNVDTGRIARYIRSWNDDGTSWDERDIVLQNWSTSFSFRIDESNNKVPYNVTNLHFLSAASGYNTAIQPDGSGTGSSNAFNVVSTYGVDGNWSYGRVDRQITNWFMYVWLAQCMDKFDNPETYVYIPYSSDNYTWEEPRYKIKTDAQNKNVAGIIVAGLTAIVVIALAIIVCKSVLKFVKSKKFAKLNAKKGKLDNAMWNCQGDGYYHLSNKEVRQYARWNRKIDKLSGASSGLAGSSSSYESISNTLTKIQQTVDGANGSLMNNSSNGVESAISNEFSNRAILYKAITGVSLD